MICNLLKIAKKKRRQVKVLLMQVIDRKLSGGEYTGSGYKGNTRPVLIDPGSMEIHIIADWMEAGLGLCHTTQMVNECRLSHNKVHVGQNAIMSAFRSMLPVITKV